MQRALACLGAALLFAVAPAACNSAGLRTSPSSTSGEAPPAYDDGTEDGSDPDAEGGSAPSKKKDAGQGTSSGSTSGGTRSADAGAREGDEIEPPPPPPANGSCPPSPALSPTTLPPGFLPAVEVDLDHMADGDSGDFWFPGNKYTKVRMLFIDTEESGGNDPTDVTEFGKQTKQVVAGYAQAATKIEIAVREKRNNPGMPDIDTYGRALSLVFFDGELLQRRLVREGRTPYYTKFGCAPKALHDSLLWAEAEANDADRGIWAPGPHYDYATRSGWATSCRPNPFVAPYCP